MGLVILGLLALYILVSILVVIGVIKYSKKNGKSALHWAGGVALVLYLIPFWDWLPTVVMHRYYCSTEAGFWIYKTFDQWRAENPGVAETLVANRGAPTKRVGDGENYTKTNFLNQRINKVVKSANNPLLNLWRYEYELVDAKSNEVLARQVDFYTAQIRGGGGWYGWKFWLHNPHCAGGVNLKDDTQELREQFVKLEVQLNGR